jgi:glycosyltransferase involved in cell wall biosynthesis
MRIGMMADLYKPHLSGVTNYIEQKAFGTRATYVFVFTMGTWLPTAVNVVRPRPADHDTGFHLNFFYTRKAKALLQTMDVVHVHHPFISGWLAMRYCQPKHIPIIFTNHTRYDLYAQAYVTILPGALSLGFLEAYLPVFCAAADMVVSPSQGMADVLRRLKVDVPIGIPNGGHPALMWMRH